MKLLTAFAAVILTLAFLSAKSQITVPKGFTQGSITLADNSVITGFLKNEIRNNAAVVLIPANGGKKITYEGTKLKSAIIDQTEYLCINGDFFKLICAGELSFLQKESDASSKPVYNGSEAIFINGTAGKPGDFYIFNNAQQQLQWVNTKNIATVSSQSFIDCDAAISKARQTGNDIALLKDAVVIYNNRNNQ